jgi:hypothetical protein
MGKDKETGRRVKEEKERGAKSTKRRWSRYRRAQGGTYA